MSNPQVNNYPRTPNTSLQLQLLLRWSLGTFWYKPFYRSKDRKSAAELSGSAGYQRPHSYRTRWTTPGLPARRWRHSQKHVSIAHQRGGVGPDGHSPVGHMVQTDASSFAVIGHKLDYTVSLMYRETYSPLIRRVNQLIAI